MEPSTNPCNLPKIKHRPKAMCAIKLLRRNKMLKRKTRLIPEVRAAENASNTNIQKRRRLNPEVRAAENASDREQHMRMRKQKKLFRKANLCNIDDLQSVDALVEPHSCGAMNIKCRECGALMWIGEKLSTSSIKAPKFGLCCLSGMVKLQELPIPPSSLRELLTNNDSVSKKFRKNIRTYNSGLAMATMKAAQDILPSGIQSYRIHGAVYRMMGPMRPDEGREPKSLQTYFVDPDQQTTIRMLGIPEQVRQTVDVNCLRDLENMLRNCNPYVQSFLCVNEMLESGAINPHEVRIGNRLTNIKEGTIHPQLQTLKSLSSFLGWEMK